MRKRPRIACLTPHAILPADRPGRQDAQQLWRALATHGEVLPIILGDVAPPPWRGLSRRAGAEYWPRRDYRRPLLEQALAQGRRDVALPALEEIRGADLPDWLWQRLGDAASLTRHFLNPRRAARLEQRLRAWRPDLILLHGAALGPLAQQLRGLGVPVVVVAEQHDSSRHATLARTAAGRALRAWHETASLAHADAEQLSAPCIDQLWLREPADVPHRRIRLLPADHPALLEAVGEALKDLGLAAGGPEDGVFAANLRIGVGQEQIRFNPHTRLLHWSFDLRLPAGPEAVSAEAEAADVPELPNAVAAVRKRPQEAVGIDLVAVLPPGLAPQQLALRIRAWGQVVLRRMPPDDIPQETAGLMLLEQDADGIAVTGWSDASSARFSPPADTLRQPLPQGPAILQGRLERFGHATALGIQPASGLGQSLPQPAEWLLPRPSTSPELAAMKDRHRGQAAWLIGNGPSVRTEDLDALRGRLTFSFNRFHLAYPRTRLRPTYTVTGDRQMIEDFGEQIVAESGNTVFLAHEEHPAVEGDYIWLRQLAVYPPLFCRQPDRLVSPGGSSLYVAMQLGYWMGVRRFYLYGADFRFVFETERGGDAFRIARGEGNHFIPGYRGGRPWCPPSLRDIAASFHIARRLMESEGGFIRNASRGGLMEIFPRQRFEDALAEA
ncbi:glycosyltransferase [Roseomonas marmotae]|uniref:Glycosyltransferase n=1 Tax=Roseomonas marmotae TaxID=2768161 RepID=A0ABS3KI47_9PROT|nr:glycosyltransferase [Roseomonas marmotae]MBO1076293.1 glycosyltransferase [Roseomonas marmotae]QTI80536.1 glycosyltransferase [Roseomonas marmotae]